MKYIDTDKINGIKSFLTGNIQDKYAVLGISSGIDSSLVLALLSLSINKDKIKAIFMPDKFTKESDYNDIKLLSEFAGVNIETVNIENIFLSYKNTLKTNDVKIEGNIRSRIRANILYYYANKLDGLVIGTTNRTEYLLGYYTKYGDGACDIEPIENLYKTDVRGMSKELNLPESIINKKPSAGLWDNQYDEDEFKMTYDELDSILKNVFDKNIINNGYEKVIETYIKSMHKREMPKSMR